MSASGGKVVAGFTMSLDGFVSDREGSVAALYPDLDALRESEPLKESIQNTGAVLMGRHAFAMAEDPDAFADNYEYQVPIFVLTHAAPKKHPRETDRLTITFVTDGIESAVAQARTAAGGRDVTVVGGPGTTQQCLRAGLADELDVYVMPVLLGGGLRPFEELDGESVQLERLSVTACAGGRTHLRFRVVR